jgi:hypothetical protein
VIYRLSFLWLYLFAIFPCVYSVPLEELIGAVHAAKLLSGGEAVIETQLRSPSPELLPRNNELQKIVNRAVNTISPNLMIETLYLYKKPEGSASWNEEQRTGLFNRILAISSLAGVQYFSQSRQTMRVFVEFSGVVDGPNTKNPLPDPVYSSSMAELTIYARQKDLTFGDNIYRYDYVFFPDAMFFEQRNISSLNVLLVPAVRRENLRSVMAVFDCGDSLLVYTVSMARALSVPGMGDRIGISFENRAKAMINWFIDRADTVFHVQ